MRVNVRSNFIVVLISIVQHYNHKKYWKRRYYVLDLKKRNLFKKYWFLLYIKRCDAYNNASFGTNINYGAFFKSPPILPHHLNGIIVSPNSKIGDNCIIFQQVTLAQDDDGFAPSIGDNVLIGAGAKIIGNVKIGNNVKIGSNCIVVEDIPDNATVVMNKPRIICKNI